MPKSEHFYQTVVLGFPVKPLYSRMMIKLKLNGMFAVSPSRSVTALNKSQTDHVQSRTYFVSSILKFMLQVIALKKSDRTCQFSPIQFEANALL